MAISGNSLYRINFEVPNPQLGEWLVGPECRRHVEKVSAEICARYQAMLPVVTGNLKAHARYDVEIGQDWGESPRWFGRVYNDALSYRRTRGKHYAQVVEYGKPARNIEGQHQLARAAYEVVGAASGLTAPPIYRDIRAKGSQYRSSKTGRFVANPHKSRRPKSK